MWVSSLEDICHLDESCDDCKSKKCHIFSGLGSIPESDTSDVSPSCQHHLPSRTADFRQVQPGSALADALGEFLLPPDPPGMESLYEEDGGSFNDVSMFNRCSSASSDSSIDIAFVKCPKAPSASHHVMAASVSTTRDVFGNGGNQGNGYSKLSKRGCASPDEAVMMRRNQHRPLQASQRKSKVSQWDKRVSSFYMWKPTCMSSLLSSPWMGCRWTTQSAVWMDLYQRTSKGWDWGAMPNWSARAVRAAKGVPPRPIRSTAPWETEWMPTNRAMIFMGCSALWVVAKMCLKCPGTLFWNQSSGNLNTTYSSYNNVIN